MRGVQNYCWMKTPSDDGRRNKYRLQRRVEYLGERDRDWHLGEMSLIQGQTEFRLLGFP